ncbi:MAG: NUDIX hydrolase [Anaerolineae bacterium]|nr:NUDIX hydrolase [Anaerolineae bacterium]
MIQPWQKLQRQHTGNFRIFDLFTDTSRSPATGRDHTFFVLSTPDWVNVIPLTPQNEVVMVRQFRHGIEAMTLEIPGGMVDREDGDAAAAAHRELLEETGYQGERYTHIGTVASNPAILDNHTHTYLAHQAHCVAPQQLDGTEEITIELIPLTEIPEMIRSGRITHALVVAAFYHLENYLR